MTGEELLSWEAFLRSWRGGCEEERIDIDADAEWILWILYLFLPFREDCLNGTT